jgi:hypothetical protein
MEPVISGIIRIVGLVILIVILLDKHKNPKDRM